MNSREAVARWRGAAVCALVLAGSWMTRRWAFGGPVLCPTRRFFGLPCPGCGMTRALARLWEGDLSASVRLHPFAPIVALVLAYGVLRPLLRGPSSRVEARLTSPLVAWSLAALLCGWHALRLALPLVSL